MYSRLYTENIIVTVLGVYFELHRKTVKLVVSTLSAFCIICQVTEVIFRVWALTYTYICVQDRWTISPV